MKRPFALTLIFGALVWTAQARLGENKDQIEDRYGKPTESLGRVSKAIEESNRYENESYSIRVDFLRDESGFEAYRKLDESPFTGAEIKRLLEANADESKWVKRGEETTHRDWWYRKDGGATACYDHQQHSFTVKSSAYQKALTSGK